MTKAEAAMWRSVIEALLAELQSHGLKPPPPYIVRDRMVLVRSETRDGRKYEKLVCAL
jgi:hypothetical protein